MAKLAIVVLAKPSYSPAICPQYKHRNLLASINYIDLPSGKAKPLKCQPKIKYIFKIQVASSFNRYDYVFVASVFV